MKLSWPILYHLRKHFASSTPPIKHINYVSEILQANHRFRPTIDLPPIPLIKPPRTQAINSRNSKSSPYRIVVAKAGQTEFQPSRLNMASIFEGLQLRVLSSPWLVQALWSWLKHNYHNTATRIGNHCQEREGESIRWKPWTWNLERLSMLSNLGSRSSSFEKGRQRPLDHLYSVLKLLDKFCSLKY